MIDEFLLEKAYLGWNIPTFVLNEENDVIYRKCEENIRINLDAVREIRKEWQKIKIPVLWQETMNIMHMGFEDDKKNLYLFGPVSFGSLSKAQILDYQFHHRWNDSGILLCNIPLWQIVSCLSTMYVLLTRRRISEKQLIGHVHSVLEEKEEWNLIENEADFFGYDNERSFIEEFKQGEMRIDENTIINNIADLELISPLARQNYIKNSEYAVVSAISAIRTAAIEAGVNEEACHKAYNRHLKKLTACTSTIEMMKVYANAVNELGKMVKSIKQRGNIGELQEQCKRYIARNIKRKFTIEEMAAELGYHSGYLSKIFSQKEGISIQRYRLKERLSLAANLLKNSNEKIGAISDYLCFHSQSYMTEQFVKEYGLTPTEYRKKNKL